MFLCIKCLPAVLRATEIKIITVLLKYVFNKVFFYRYTQLIKAQFFVGECVYHSKIIRNTRVVRVEVGETRSETNVVYLLFF